MDPSRRTRARIRHRADLLLSDSSIIEVAKRKPHNAAQFRSIRSINERVRIHTDSEQDKMFERYAPIQRKVKPSVWRETIRRALELPPSQWPVMPAPWPTRSMRTHLAR